MKGPEAIIEDDNVRYAEGLGLLVLKLRLLGTIGWPDRLFLAPGGRVMFVEYKAPGKKPRPSQVKIHNTLKRYGFHVYTVDHIPAGRELLRRFTENEELPESGTHFKLFETKKEKFKQEICCPKHDTGGGPCYCGRRPA